MADVPTIKVEAPEPGESSETGSVQVNSAIIENVKDVEKNDPLPQEVKEQVVQEAVLDEKVLLDEVGKQQESKGNNEESGEEENGSKFEEWMVVDEDDDDELNESMEKEKTKGNEKMDEDKEGQEDKQERTLLATITVNIGPIRLEDLDSDQMRDILNYSKGYTLTFEKKEEGLLSKEKERAKHEGFVKIPYMFYNDAYLMKTYNKLRNLRINNRDLSVTFPEEFIKITEDCASRIRQRQERRRQIQEMRRANVETKKKSLFAKNIPPDIKEETLKAEFPGCTNVVIPKNLEGISIGFAVLEFESIESSTKCLETHNNVEIQNHKIQLNKMSLSGAPDDGTLMKRNRPRGKRGGRGLRNQQKGNQQQRGNRQQRGNQRWGNQQQNRQRNNRNQNGDRRGPRNDQSRRQSGPYNRGIQMPPPLMGNISTLSRYGNGRGMEELGYGRQNNRGGILGQAPKRSRSPSNGRDQKRFRGESSYGRMDDSRQRGDARMGNASGWGFPANTGRSRSPAGEAEATLAYLRQQLTVMEKKLMHSPQPIAPSIPMSSSGRSYGSGGYTALSPAGTVSSSGRSYGGGGHTALLALPSAGLVSTSGRSYGSGYGTGTGGLAVVPPAGPASSSGRSYSSGGLPVGGSGGAGYSSGIQSSGYGGSSIGPVSGYASGGYTGGYNYSGYGSGSHTSDSKQSGYAAYHTGSQSRSGGGSSRIEDAYNSFMSSISGR
ncbi:hypothetical protein ACJMK2_035338 [Sinanodonta woodiana]|uniref:RRM domain-containing protein n=1 Tax=Sinanodonta woodiana TaxID=1069815 RepID=A0ABD3WUL9_SINWO